jgi:hypothetical protein
VERSGAAISLPSRSPPGFSLQQPNPREVCYWFNVHNLKSEFKVKFKVVEYTR